MTRRDLVKAISPSRRGSDKSKWNPDELSRTEAEKVVNIFFDSIVGALRKGEKVTLPLCTFEVLEHTTPTRGWFLKRVRVIYAQRMHIQFTPSERCLEQVAGGVKDGA